jgi:2-polyprenyl-6-hydroxyphenyl methylase/3-demethylubiquinone-9 3-methyltransferase
MLKLIKSQKWLSREFDKILPEKFNFKAGYDFTNSLLPKYLADNLTIYDIGGGKRPHLTPSKKKLLDAKVIGLDIDKTELENAPKNSYDYTINADTTSYKGEKDTDLIICKAVLEHVKDIEAAFNSISSILKNGGIALIFVPCKNAVFTRMNLLVPQKWKEYLISLFRPQLEKASGFPAYYDKCTPKELKKIGIKNNLVTIEEKIGYKSSYFNIFFPYIYLTDYGLSYFMPFARNKLRNHFL